MERPKTLSNLTLTDEHLRGIGLITAEWSRLENILEMLIWLLAKLDFGLGPIVTTHMTFPLRMNVLRTLCHKTYADSSTHEEAKILIKRIEASKVQRDRIAHAHWHKPGRKKASVFATQVKARKELLFISEDMSIADLEEIAENITELIYDISDFMERYLPFS